MAEKIRGTYLHYSGKKYKIIALGHDSSTLQPVVVYQGLYNDAQFGKKPVWVRSQKEFQEKVLHNGKKTLRFKKIRKNSNA